MNAMGAVGMGANVVGGLMQSIAASKARKEMEQAMASFLSQQRGYRGDAMEVFNPSLEYRSAETAKSQLAQGRAQRNAEFDRLGATPMSMNSPGPNARDQAYTKMRGDARANLGSYSDWQLLQDINNLRTQQELNKISNFAGGNAQLFPHRMEDASHSYDELAFWGNLISSIGGSAGSWGTMFGQPQNGGTPGGNVGGVIGGQLGAGLGGAANPWGVYSM